VDIAFSIENRMGIGLSYVSQEVRDLLLSLFTDAPASKYFSVSILLTADDLYSHVDKLKQADIGFIALDSIGKE
jgi:hypothetical protein